MNKKIKTALSLVAIGVCLYGAGAAAGMLIGGENTAEALELICSNPVSKAGAVISMEPGAIPAEVRLEAMCKTVDIVGGAL